MLQLPDAALGPLAGLVPPLFGAHVLVVRCVRKYETDDMKPMIASCACCVGASQCVSRTGVESIRAAQWRGRAQQAPGSAAPEGSWPDQICSTLVPMPSPFRPNPFRPERCLLSDQSFCPVQKPFEIRVACSLRCVPRSKRHQNERTMTEPTPLTCFRRSKTADQLEEARRSPIVLSLTAFGLGVRPPPPSTFQRVVNLMCSPPDPRKRNPRYPGGCVCTKA